MKKILLTNIIIGVFIGAIMLKSTEDAEQISQTKQTEPQPIDVQQEDPEDIFQAAAQGNLTSVKAFLAQGININTQDERGSTALIQAVYGNHLHIIEFLVEQGADVNLITKDGWSALLFASNRDTFRYLLKHNADSTATTESGFNILMAAAYAGDKATLADLIKQGADINAKDKYAWSLLINAIKGEHFDVVKYLIDNGADVNTKTVHGWTPIMVAAEGKSLAIIKYLVKNGADINVKSPDGWSLLMLAAKLGDLNIIQYLIDQKSNIHAKDQSLGWNTLSVAVYNNHLELAKILINKGLDISVTTKDNETLLHIAAMNDCVEIARYLIKNGIDIKSKAKWTNNTALHTAAFSGAINTLTYLMEEVEIPNDDVKTELLNAAARGGHLAIIEYLYSKGVDINDQVHNGELNYFDNPLMTAARYGQSDVVNFLIDKGADINFRNQNGDTALMYAAMIDEFDLKRYAKSTKKTSPRDNMSVIRALVKNGADINAKNNQGKTALYELIKNKSDNITAFTYLLNKGADANITDKDAKSLLYYASRDNRIEHGKHGKKYIELLLEKGATVTTDSIDATMYRTDVFELLLSKMENDKELDEQTLSKLLYSTLGSSTSLLETIKVLVHKGVNLETLNNYYDETPLMRAAFHRHTSIVQYFLTQGVKVNATNSTGKTALMKAVAPKNNHLCGNLDVIQHLVESGANITIKDRNQTTALNIAFNYRCIDTFNYLLDIIIAKNLKEKIDTEQLFEYIEFTTKNYSEFKESLEQRGITR